MRAMKAMARVAGMHKNGAICDTIYTGRPRSALTQRGLSTSPFDYTEQGASMKAIPYELASLLVDRIAPRITVSDSGCWVGPYLNPYTGYSSLSRTVDGKVTYYYSHRVMYTFVVGPIPDGLTIDHLCKNPGCCNPDHLEAVTQRENVHRSNNPAAIKARMTACAKGHEFTVLPNGRRRCLECKRESDANRIRPSRAKSARVAP